MPTSPLQAESRRSYARRDFNQTLDLVDELVREEPEDARYHEMRAAVRVDNKNFATALEDYDKALSSTPGRHPFLCLPVPVQSAGALPPGRVRASVHTARPAAPPVYRKGIECTR